MAKYAGDQVQATLDGNSLAATHYARTKPSTRFSTRQLAIVEISLTGVSTNPYAPNSLYSKAVRGIQTVAEIQMLGEPSGVYFIAVVALDTLNNGGNTSIGTEENLCSGLGPNDQTGLPTNSDYRVGDVLVNNPHGQTLLDAINSATGSECGIVFRHFHGNGLSNTNLFYSDESLTEDC
jgi:hypothetical protein